MSAVAFEFADPQALMAAPNGAVKIAVTADDMARGERFQACSCPIALAVARTLGLPNWNVTVSLGDVLVRDNSGRLIRWWRMDERGRSFDVFWRACQRGQQPVSFWLIPQPLPWMDVDSILRLPPDEQADLQVWNGAEMTAVEEVVCVA